MLPLVTVNATELQEGIITVVTLRVSLYVYHPNDTVWESCKEILD